MNQSAKKTNPIAAYDSDSDDWGKDFEMDDESQFSVGTQVLKKHILSKIEVIHNFKEKWNFGILFEFFTVFSRFFLY